MTGEIVEITIKTRKSNWSGYAVRKRTISNDNRAVMDQTLYRKEQF